MKRILIYVFLILSGIVFSVVFLSQRTEKNENDYVATIPSTEGEVRGIWVASVLNLDYPIAPTDSEAELKNQADEILDNVKEWGFNTVFCK